MYVLERCVCVCERERCVCVPEREREREREKERERKNIGVLSRFCAVGSAFFSYGHTVIYQKYHLINIFKNQNTQN